MNALAMQIAGKAQRLAGPLVPSTNGVSRRAFQQGLAGSQPSRSPRQFAKSGMIALLLAMVSVWLKSARSQCSERSHSTCSSNPPENSGPPWSTDYQIGWHGEQQPIRPSAWDSLGSSRGNLGSWSSFTCSDCCALLSRGALFPHE